MAAVELTWTSKVVNHTWSTIFIAQLTPLPTANYFSKKLNKHQKNYSTIEKETLSLMLAISHFEVYVTGPFPVTVFTDHNPLTYLNKFKNKSQRLMRWSLLLQGYNLEFEHIPGKQNIIADGLSRSWIFQNLSLMRYLRIKSAVYLNCINHSFVMWDLLIDNG